MIELPDSYYLDRAEHEAHEGDGPDNDPAELTYGSDPFHDDQETAEEADWQRSGERGLGH